MFHKEEECNYFSDSLHVICVVATSSSLDSSPLISLPFHIVSYMPKSTCQIFSELICFFCWPVCKMLHVMKLLSIAAEVGSILSIETATFENFEL